MLYVCKICSDKFDHVRSLTSHLKKNHNMSSKEYYDSFFKSVGEGICPNCGNETTFRNLKKAYDICCSKSCSASINKHRKETKQKISKANKEKSKSSLEKRKETNLNRYGVANTYQSDEKKRIIREACLKKYGVVNAAQSKEVKEKIKETCQSRYGVNHALSSEKIKTKIKNTFIEKYGHDNPAKNDIIKEKIKQTCIEKYGETVPSKNKEIKEKISKAHLLKGYKNILKYKNVIPLFNFSEYVGIVNNEYGYNRYNWKCKICGNEFSDHLQTYPRCLICDPRKNSYTSNVEKEMQIWLGGHLNIECNKRFSSKQKTYELDVFIQSHNLGIEFNGIYWHSELAGKDKRYHIEKNKWFKDNFNVDIIHIFESEWVLKQDIVKSIILNRIGLIDKRIYARKCKYSEIDSPTYRAFLDNNHIQGAMNSKFRCGLFFKNELVSVIGFGKSRFANESELHRYCNKLGYSIVGGFSKLLKNSNFKGTTFCDKRYFNGNGYNKVGFEFLNDTGPNYWYFKNNDLTLYNRINFQKHKLKDKLDTFDPELTEWENMQMNGWNRIWDCGNIKLIKR